MLCFCSLLGFFILRWLLDPILLRFGFLFFWLCIIPNLEHFLGIPIHELSHDLKWHCSNNPIFEVPIGPIDDCHWKRKRLQLEARVLVEMAVHFVELNILSLDQLVL